MTTPTSPMIPIVTNQSDMIGPNSIEIRPVPCGCKQNNMISTTIDSGIT